MKWVLNIVGSLLILIGSVWFLQGINILLGSFMSGQTQWMIIGIVVAIIGVGLLVFVNRRGKSGPSTTETETGN